MPQKELEDMLKEVHRVSKILQAIPDGDDGDVIDNIIAYEDAIMQRVQRSLDSLRRNRLKVAK